MTPKASCKIARFFNVSTPSEGERTRFTHLQNKVVGLIESIWGARAKAMKTVSMRTCNMPYKLAPCRVLRQNRERCVQCIIRNADFTAMLLAPVFSGLMLLWRALSRTPPRSTTNAIFLFNPFGLTYEVVSPQWSRSCRRFFRRRWLQAQQSLVRPFAHISFR